MERERPRGDVTGDAGAYKGNLITVVRAFEVGVQRRGRPPHPPAYIHMHIHVHVHVRVHGHVHVHIQAHVRLGGRRGQTVGQVFA